MNRWASDGDVADCYFPELCVSSPLSMLSPPPSFPHVKPPHWARPPQVCHPSLTLLFKHLSLPWPQDSWPNPRAQGLRVLVPLSSHSHTGCTHCFSFFKSTGHMTGNNKYQWINSLKGYLNEFGVKQGNKPKSLSRDSMNILLIQR